MENLISNKKYFVAPLNSSKAYQFMCAYHYSHIGFKKSSLNLGIFNKTNNLLVGVLQWGCAAQSKIRLDDYVKNPITTDEYLELNRFAMADSEGRNSESQAISLGIKWIRQNRPDIRLLVSYSGRVEGNYGYIYQATNWEYLGYFISNGFWKLDGEERHHSTVQYSYKKYGEGYENIVDYLTNTYNSVSRYKSKQFVYIMRLDKKLIPATEILPYPKPATDYPIQTEEKVYKESKEVNEKAPIEPPLFYYNPNEPLFTRSCLRRRKSANYRLEKPSLDKPRLKRKKFVKEEVYLIYSKQGKLEGIYNNAIEINSKFPEYSTSGIYTSIKTQSLYKDKYFRRVRKSLTYPEELGVSPICWIEGIPYYKQKDLVKALGVSRQAVSACVKRKGKTLGGKEVIWEFNN